MRGRLEGIIISNERQDKVRIWLSSAGDIKRSLLFRNTNDACLGQLTFILEFEALLQALGKR